MTMGAQEKEGQLAAAGFVRQQADTPQKVAKLQALPQNTIVFSQRKKGNVYIYADAAGCGCAFIGNDAAYQQYQQIRQQHRSDARDHGALEPGSRDGLGEAFGALMLPAGIDRRACRVAQLRFARATPDFNMSLPPFTTIDTRDWPAAFECKRPSGGHCRPFDGHTRSSSQ